ncbi:placenta-specific gene 8 protein [Carlito syrichta]|uniref:Placenta-specific gene 8 protein n=1 Tax=Carlito syrichta TaxID=1868482 RepID=A0A1U7T7N3_CARSF|nr:placenta-specific gene 8 protein [Carlito syrichta]
MGLGGDADAKLKEALVVTWRQGCGKGPRVGTTAVTAAGVGGVTCAPGVLCPGLCGTFCFMCLGCQVASDMNECCLCGTTVAMRTLYRTRYGIPGSICDDFMATLCCPVCSVCQIKRDINRRRAMHAF